MIRLTFALTLAVCLPTALCLAAETDACNAGEEGFVSLFNGRDLVGWIGSTKCFVGEGGDLTIHVSEDTIRKGLTLHGAWHYNLADAPKIIEVIQRHGHLLDELITHTFPMSRVKEAFELQLTGKCGKVVLHPWK